MINLEESMTIQIMYKQGYSKKHIARELGISINTVRKYIDDDNCPSYSKRAQKPMKLDPYRSYIKKRLEDAHPHWIPATVIYREIKAQGYTGKESMLRIYMRQQKPVVKEEVIRFETEPGKQMQVDWAEFRKGENRLAAFIATLGYSRTSYVEFVTDEKLNTLLQCHEHAFDYFGGVPQEILYDNMKTVIVERDCYGEGKHRLQSGFWDFSKYYNFIPKVCRPYRAQTKGKVERFIHFLRYSFYYPLVGELRSSGLIVDQPMANYKVLHWLNEVANQRCHATTGEIPFVRLQKEHQHLQTVPVSYLGAFSQKEPQKIKNNYIDIMEHSIQHPLDIYDTLLEEGVVVGGL
jgi:transposase